MRDAITAGALLAWFAGIAIVAHVALRRTVRESLELLAELVREGDRA